MTTTTKAGKKYPRALIHRHGKNGTPWVIHLIRSPTETPGPRNDINAFFSINAAERFAREYVDDARNEPEPTA